MTKLSQRQRKRLGAILAVLADKSPEEELRHQLIEDGFATLADGKVVLTTRGMSERQRLVTLAGLNFEEK